MKRRAGMTLIEVLVSLAVMGVLFAASYAFVHDSYRLQDQLLGESTQLIDRCSLADRLAVDLRSNRGVQRPGTGQWTVSLGDGTEVSYQEVGPRVIRECQQSRRVFHVGTTDVVAVDGGLRLRFADTELFLRGGKR
jgi:prepilin-type N-terminal cleavage/methylation domain-containing protein